MGPLGGQRTNVNVGASYPSFHESAETEHLAITREVDQLDRAPLARLEAHRGARRDVQAHATRRIAVELQGAIGFGEVIVRAHLDRPLGGVAHDQREGAAARVERVVARIGEELAGDHAHSSRASQIAIVASTATNRKPDTSVACQCESGRPCPPCASALMGAASSAAAIASGSANRIMVGSSREWVQTTGWCTVTSLVPSGKVASTWMSGIISATPSMTSSRVSTVRPSLMSWATLLPSRAPS